MFWICFWWVWYVFEVVYVYFHVCLRMFIYALCMCMYIWCAHDDDVSEFKKQSDKYITLVKIDIHIHKIYKPNQQYVHYLIFKLCLWCGFCTVVFICFWNFLHVSDLVYDVVSRTCCFQTCFCMCFVIVFSDWLSDVFFLMLMMMMLMMFQRFRFRTDSSSSYCDAFESAHLPPWTAHRTEPERFAG
jgi:hypothetical protein